LFDILLDIPVYSIAVLAMVLDVNLRLAAGDSTSQQTDLSLLLFD
jgi:hypothetical protein